jgi:hypothetical protein
MNEPAVEIGEAKEGLNVLDFPRFGPIEDSLDFVTGHGEPGGREDVSEVLDGLRVPFALLRLEVKSVRAEAAEDFTDMLAVRGDIGGVDEDVVEVNHDAHIQHICKDAIDKSLERGGGVSETEGHY